MHKPTTATTTVGFGLRAEDHIVMRQLAAQRDSMTQTSRAEIAMLQTSPTETAAQVLARPTVMTQV